MKLRTNLLISFAVMVCIMVLMIIFWVQVELASLRAVEREFNLFIAAGAVGAMAGLLIMLRLIWRMTEGFRKITTAIKDFSGEHIDYTQRINLDTGDELGDIARAFNQLADELQEKSQYEQKYIQSQEEQVWLQTKIAKLTGFLHGKNDLSKVLKTFIQELVPVIGCNYGAIYLTDEVDDKTVLRLQAGYALYDMTRYKNVIAIGEGLVGQAAASKRWINLEEVPADYIKIHSGIGETEPKSLLIVPILFEEKVKGVIELASITQITEIQRKLISEIVESVGTTVNTIRGQMRVEALLCESQTLTEELQTQSEELMSQQEELTRSNEQLNERTRELKESEELLQAQQAELERSNRALKQKTIELENQIEETKQKNEQLEKSRKEIEQQAIQLALTSKYKSEFLANMSHELRTPLNSLLLLSQFLVDNKDNNLSSQEVEYAKTINESGNDLLKLINEILDLSKVEAGKMEVNPDPASMQELCEYAERSFRHIARDYGLDYEVRKEDDVPEVVVTDIQRLQQIIRNLLSNAFKFTHKGGVVLHVRMAGEEELRAFSLTESKSIIAFDVIDTGIGIEKTKQEMIFEAFQQVDGTTSRLYGGTGLGLSISRRMSELLGGSIVVKSEVNEGSTFTLLLPTNYGEEQLVAQYESAAGMECLTKDASVSSAAKQMESTSEIMFNDHRWKDQIKSEPEAEESKQITDSNLEYDEAADKVLADKRVLIVDDDERNLFALSQILARFNMEVLVAKNGREAIKMMGTHYPVDLVLMDIMMPEMDGYEAIRNIRKHKKWRELPIIAVTAKAMKVDRELCIEAGASDYIAKPVNTDQLISLLKVWLYT